MIFSRGPQFIVLVGLASMLQPERNSLGAAERVTAWVGTNRVTMTISGGERLISANGLPDHEPGHFPRRGNPNSISAQDYHFRLPAQPKIASRPRAINHSLFGVALNGVPFDPGTAEFWKNDRRSPWNYEAKSGSIDLGLDENNAHVQPNGAYHYHALPVGLVKLREKSTSEKSMLLVGYAADGFPIYSSCGNSQPTNAKSPLKMMQSSYRLKKGLRPDGPGGLYDGTFTADFEYVPGSGDLDECNGRFGVTSEFPQGIYHYYITEDFPWIPRSWRGTPDPSFMKRNPRPARLPPGSPRN